MKVKIGSIDISGMMLSLSGVILGILLAVSDYHVSWEPALAVIVTTVLLHVYMSSGSRMFLLASLAAAVLATWLSFGKILAIESLLLLLFSWFVIRFARGIKESGRISEAVANCLLYGPIALFGSYFVCTHSFGFWILLLPAFSVGLLAVAVEGLSDGYGRNVVTILITLALMLVTGFSFMRIFHISHYAYVVTIPAFIIYVVRMYRKEQDLLSYRPALALCTLALAVLTGLGYVGYLF